MGSPLLLFDAIDATWPAAHLHQSGPWTLREGAGGGKRVSAATKAAPFREGDIAKAEDAMIALGQTSLFMIRPQDSDLDAALAARDYRVIDPVVVLACPVEHLTNTPVPKVTTFEIWEPLAIMKEIWAQGGVGPARLEIMRRPATKTAILARWNQKPAGTGFVAVDGTTAMVHAVEVLPDQRRQGVAQWIMRQAAFWAAKQGAENMAVLCVKTNAAALALYSGLGFERVTAYHYRQKPIDGVPDHG